MADYTKENYLTAGAQPEETTAPTTPSAQDNSATTPLSKPTAGADATPSSPEAQPEENTSWSAETNMFESPSHGSTGIVPYEAGQEPKGDGQTTAEPTSTTTTTAPEGSDGSRRMSYTELFKQYYGDGDTRTEEEKKKEAKKKKREQIFAAIGDGISALSNLFFATKGAPNMYNPTKTQSATVKDKWDKIEADREAKKKEYFNGYLKASEADDRERKWQRQLGLDKIAADEKKAKQEREDALAEAKRGLLAAQTAKNDAQAAFWQTKDEALVDGLPLDVALKKAKIAKENAVAEKNRRQSAAGWRSSSGGDYSWYDADGNEHHEKTAEQAKRRALEARTWVDHETTTTTQRRNLTGTTTTRTTRASGGYSAKPAAKTAKPAATNTKKIGW